MYYLYFNNRETTTGAGEVAVNGKSREKWQKAKPEKRAQTDLTSKILNPTLGFCQMWLLSNSEYAFQIDF